MAHQRTILPAGTQIQTEQGSLYRISGEPIGSGGGSLIYPVQHLVARDGGLYPDGLDYALKECYPVSFQRSFRRGPQGEILPQDGEDALYLEQCRQLQLGEGRVSQAIYKTASRMLPIRESSPTITLTLPGGPAARVNNTVTVMDALSEKGRSLSAWLRERGRFTPAETLRILQQLLFALEEVHGAGYLHLDIQDGNVFLRGALEDKSELVTLIDFGCARPLEGSCTAPIRDRVIFTTRSFSAPEILLKNDGSLRLGPQADLYSLGCLALYLLTGQKPDPNALLGNTTGLFLAPNQLRRIRCPKHLVARLQGLLARSLAREPENRYPTAEAMLKDVTELAEALQPYRSDLSGLVYDAFVCYRHGPVDSRVAKRIQQKLESFRAPRGAGPRRPFRRVFVDEGELSSCADFGEQIRTALKNSGWLIVVCSPDTPLSPWVQKEIDTFLQYHDRSRILAVLTAGEPKDAFPPQLLGAPDGSGQVLAADIRGKHLTSDALLRLAAPMLGMPFDSLKQRRRSRRFQQLAAVSGLALAAALAFSAYALRQNRRIQAEYQRNLTNQSKYLSVLALEALEDGDPMEALSIALEALPTRDQERPVIPLAQYVLEQALGLYALDDGSLIRYATVEGVFDHAYPVEDGYYWDEEREVLISSDRAYLYIWDAETAALRQQLAFSSEYQGVFRPEMVDAQRGYVCYGCQDQIYCYDYVNLRLVWQHSVPEADTVEDILPLGQGQVAAITYQSYPTRLQVMLLDAETGLLQKAYPIALPGELYVGTVYDPMLAASGDTLAFLLAFDDRQQEWGSTDLTDVRRDSLTLLDLATGEVSFLHPEAGQADSLRFTPEGLLLLGARDRGVTGMGQFRIYSQTTQRFLGVEPATKSILWEYQDTYGGFYDQSHIRFDADDPGIAVVSYANRCAVLELDTGHCREQMELSASVVNHTSGRDGKFRAFTADGYTYVCRYGDNQFSGSPFWSGEVWDVLGSGQVSLVQSSEDGSLIRRCNRAYQDENWKQLLENAKPPQCDLIRHHVQGPYILVYDNYGLPMTVYNTETGLLRQTVLSGGGAGCRIYLEDPLGILTVDGREQMGFLCSDSCENPSHGYHALLLVALDTLECRLVSLPVPVEPLLQPVYTVTADGWQVPTGEYAPMDCPLTIHTAFQLAHTDREVYYACTAGFFNEEQMPMEAVFLYAWDLTQAAPRQLAAYSRRQAENRLSPGNLTLSPDGRHLLILDESWNFDGSGYLSQVLLADIQEGTCRVLLPQQPLRSSLSHLYGSHLYWNSDGSLFAVPLDDCIGVYDLTGTERCTIPYPEAGDEVTSLSFVPGTEELLVLAEDIRLELYSLETGALLEQTSLPAYASGRIQWQYVREDLLILDYYYGLMALNPRRETWGLASLIASGIGYDAAGDGYYTLSQADSGQHPLGWFRRYAVEEIVEMGRQAAGAQQEDS